MGLSWHGRDCARMSPLQRCAAAAVAMLLHCCAAAMLLSAQGISLWAGKAPRGQSTLQS